MPTEHAPLEPTSKKEIIRRLRAQDAPTFSLRASPRALAALLAWTEGRELTVDGFGALDVAGMRAVLGSLGVSKKLRRKANRARLIELFRAREKEPAVSETETLAGSESESESETESETESESESESETESVSESVSVSEIQSETASEPESNSEPAPIVDPSLRLCAFARNSSSEAESETETAAPAEAAERRRAPRVALDVDIGYRSETNFYTGFSEDLSEGGIFIATVELLPVGQAVEVFFVLPEGDAVYADGTVTWIRQGRSFDSELASGMGIAFEGLDEVHEEAVRRYMRRRPPLFYVD